MFDLLTQVVVRAKRGEVVALCSVVRTHGSTPQNSGAAMLVLRDGTTLGTLGGGCVEAEVRLRAQQLMQKSQTRLLRFRLDQDYGWDDGLVCGGVMEIAVRVIASASDAAFARTILDELSADRVGSLVFEAVDEKEATGRFEIQIPPTPQLIIAGAGHVAYALAGIAAAIDFRVTVVDDRADYVVASRFPKAVCIAGNIEAELARCDIDPQTYVVIVTRGHKHDAQALAAVIHSPAAYLGLIGSKRKISQIFEELHQAGASPEKLARVHAPIGLEIAAVTPEEIAVSIAAELIAVRRGRGDQPATPMKMSAEQLRRLLQKNNHAEPEDEWSITT